MIRGGTILERPGDGCQVKMSSVDGLSAAVTAYGNTSLADDPGPVAWDIISEVWSDFRDASGPRSLERTFREVGTQIFAETFEIPKTRKNTKYEIIPYEAEHQIIALIAKLRRQLAYAVLRSRPFHDGSHFIWGNRTEEPTMCGLCTWPTVTYNELPNPNVYVNKNGQALTKVDLDNLVRQLWLDEHADYNKGDWWIVCHPSTHQFIQDFDICYRRIEKKDKSIGFHVDEFHSKIGKTFPILSERFMRPGVLIAVNFKALQIRLLCKRFSGTPRNSHSGQISTLAYLISNLRRSGSESQSQYRHDLRFASQLASHTTKEAAFPESCLWVC